MDVNKKTKIPVPFLVPVFLLLIAGGSLLGTAATILFAPNRAFQLAAIFFAPVTFSAALVGISAFLSWPFQKAVVGGKFPRQLDNFVYGPRRLYGLCWGAVFYCTPVYYAFLSVPFLRTALLRAFGYRGSSNVVIAPDAWIRDLPVLKLDDGAYAANKSTLATNMCLSDGTVIVDRIKLGKKCMIGHMAMVAPGFTAGEDSEVGAGVAAGIRSRIGNRARLGPTTTINHGSQIGEGAEIGTMSYVGVKAQIGDGVRLPGGSNIPDGAQILTQEDVHKHLSSETMSLEADRERLEHIYLSRMRGTGQTPTVQASVAETTTTK